MIVPARPGALSTCAVSVHTHGVGRAYWAIERARMVRSICFFTGVLVFVVSYPCLEFELQSMGCARVFRGMWPECQSTLGTSFESAITMLVAFLEQTRRLHLVSWQHPRVRLISSSARRGRKKLHTEIHSCVASKGMSNELTMQDKRASELVIILI